jgi:peptidoglycan hydrolase CwlO-like protein
MKNGKKILLFFTTLSFFLGFVVIAKAQCSNQDECNDLIKQYTEQISILQGQAKTLKNQIAQFDAQIKLTTLKITQTQEQIALLGERIDQLGVSLDSLTAAFSSRAVETYKMSRFESNFFFILSASDIGDAVARFHYLEKIQEEDRSLLQKLQEAQTTYQGQKADQETLQKQLQQQQTSLNNQKIAKNNLLKITQNDEVRYQSLLAQANAQLRSFSNYAATHGGATLLDNQTRCNEGWTGCYYNQRDSAWGNMYLGLTSFLMKDSGCFVTSVAMLASHNGKNIKPNDIAALPDAFAGGDVIHDFDINGVHVHIENDNPSALDSYLSAGQPVMAKLYGGTNQHFIVIIRKEGDTYMMNDPFLKDGYNKPLSAGGHNISNIVSLRTVSF